jgi:signal peptidase I
MSINNKVKERMDYGYRGERRKNRRADGKEYGERSIEHGVIYCRCIVYYLFGSEICRTEDTGGHSMENTLFDGDNLIVDKISYRFTDPKRFDIIVFPYHYKEDTYYIKRIIGLPGETVQIRDGEIYIDGAILEEDYGKETMLTSGRAADQIQLGEDEYFVLGDNRNHSEDSRFDDVGNIERSEIIGRAFIRIWPFERFGLLKHQ